MDVVFVYQEKKICNASISAGCDEGLECAQYALDGSKRHRARCVAAQHVAALADHKRLATFMVVVADRCKGAQKVSKAAWLQLNVCSDTMHFTGGQQL